MAVCKSLFFNKHAHVCHFTRISQSSVFDTVSQKSHICLAITLTPTRTDFGNFCCRNVMPTEKESNQKMLYFPVSSNYCFCATGHPEIVYFQFNSGRCFANIQNTLKHNWSQLNHLSLPAGWAQHIRQYLHYSGTILIFCPTGAKLCTSGGEIWHGGRLLHAKFHPISTGVGA